MLLLTLATKLQALSPIRITDAEALGLAQGLLEDFIIQERPKTPWTKSGLMEVPRQEGACI